MKKFLCIAFLHSFILSAQVDLQIDSIFHRSGVGGFFEQGLTYYEVTQNQYTDIEFSALLSNAGTSIATNTYLHVEVYKDGLLDAALNSDSTNLCSTCSDSLFAGSYVINQVATYEFRYTVWCDSIENLTNNSDSVIVFGTDQLGHYRRDNGIQLGASSSFQINTDPMSLGPIFEIFEDDEMRMVSIVITDDSSNIGQLIYGTIYKFNAMDSSWMYVSQTGDYTIQSIDLGGMINLDLYSCISLDAGDLILVTGGHYGGPNPVNIKLAQSVDNETVIFATQSGLYTDSTSSLINCPMVFPRMSDGYHCHYSIPEGDDLNSLKVYPNPAKSKVHVNFDFESSQNGEIFVLDECGKLIMTKLVKNLVCGNNSVCLDISDLKNGLYFIRFMDNHESKQIRLVVEK